MNPDIDTHNFVDLKDHCVLCLRSCVGEQEQHSHHEPSTSSSSSANDDALRACNIRLCKRFVKHVTQTLEIDSPIVSLKVAGSEEFVQKEGVWRDLVKGRVCPTCQPKVERFCEYKKQIDELRMKITHILKDVAHQISETDNGKQGQMTKKKLENVMKGENMDMSFPILYFLRNEIVNQVSSRNQLASAACLPTPDPVPIVELNEISSDDFGTSQNGMNESVEQSDPNQTEVAASNSNLVPSSSSYTKKKQTATRTMYRCKGGCTRKFFSRKKRDEHERQVHVGENETEAQQMNVTDDSGVGDLGLPSAPKRICLRGVDNSDNGNGGQIIIPPLLEGSTPAQEQSRPVASAALSIPENSLPVEKNTIQTVYKCCDCDLTSTDPMELSEHYEAAHFQSNKEQSKTKHQNEEDARAAEDARVAENARAAEDAQAAEDARAAEDAQAAEDAGAAEDDRAVEEAWAAEDPPVSASPEVNENWRSQSISDNQGQPDAPVVPDVPARKIYTIKKRAFRCDMKDCSAVFMKPENLDEHKKACHDPSYIPNVLEAVSLVQKIVPPEKNIAKPRKGEQQIIMNGIVIGYGPKLKEKETLEKSLSDKLNPKYHGKSLRKGRASSKRKRRTHQKRQLKCVQPNCKGKFHDEDELAYHSLSHRRDFRCHYCVSICETPGALAMHELECHPRPSTSKSTGVSCPVCPASFPHENNQKLYRFHFIEKHMGITGPLFPCKSPDCNDIFARIGILKKHMKRVHKNESLPSKHSLETGANHGNDESILDAAPQSPKPMYKCNICEDCFPSSILLQNHNRVVHKELKHCNKCPRSFTSQKALDQHNSVAHLPVFRRYCKLCPKPRLFKDRIKYFNHVQFFHIKRENSEQESSSVQQPEEQESQQNFEALECDLVTRVKLRNRKSLLKNLDERPVHRSLTRQGLLQPKRKRGRPAKGKKNSKISTKNMGPPLLKPVTPESELELIEPQTPETQPNNVDMPMLHTSEPTPPLPAENSDTNSDLEDQFRPVTPTDSASSHTKHQLFSTNQIKEEEQESFGKRSRTYLNLKSRYKHKHNQEIQVIDID